MQRVRRRRRDLGIAARGRERQDGVVRIVERMQSVVGATRMVGLPAVDLLRDRSGLHPGPKGARRPAIRRAAGIGDPEQGERVECGRLQVVRVLAVDILHGRDVSPIARCLLALAVERLDGLDVASLAWSDVRRVRKAGENLSPGVGILRIAPDRVIVRHRLGPIGHGEARLDAAAARNSSSATGYQDECSTATPRRK